MSLVPRAQARILLSRYLACQLGDWPTLLLLVVQAPFIGWLATVVWASIARDTPTLYFVMCLSAVWFGCITSCREIVKERAILERERFFGLSVPAYVASKFGVLAVLGLVQVLGLQLTIEARLSLRGPLPVETLALWGCSLCGTGLGLLISAWSRTQERAVGLVPLLILPQILFSPFTVPEDQWSDAVRWGERGMPVGWGYRAFEEAAALEPSWLTVGADTGALYLYAFGLLAAVALALVPRRDVA